MSGTNTYTGGTAVNGGTLSISSDANLGNGGTVALADGATLAFTAGGAYGHALTVAGNSTLNVASGQTVTQNAAIANGGSAGALIKAGNGTLTLTAANTYTGGTVINGGTLQLSGAARWAVPRGRRRSPAARSISAARRKPRMAASPCRGARCRTAPCRRRAPSRCRRAW